MTSDFFAENGGFLAYNDEAWEEKKKEPEVAAAIAADAKQEVLLRRAGSVLNVSTHGYYEHQRYLKDVKGAAEIIKANFKGKFNTCVKKRAAGRA